MTKVEALIEAFNRNDPLIAIEAMDSYIRDLIKRLKILEMDREDAYQEASLEILDYFYNHETSNFIMADLYRVIKDAVKMYCNQSIEKFDIDVGYTIEEEVEDRLFTDHIYYCIENDLFGNRQKVIQLLLQSYNLTEISKIISVTPERVRQLRFKAHITLEKEEYKRRN